MNDKMNLSRTSILLILITLLLIASLSYIGFEKYKSYQAQKTEKDNQISELTKSQQKALEDAQGEIERLKEQSLVSIENQNTLEKRITSQPKVTSTSNNTISAQDLAPYLTGVVEIICPTDETAKTSVTTANTSRGSGTLWRNQSVLTNSHVIEGAVSACSAFAYTNDSIVEGGFGIDPNSGYGVWNTLTDVALLSGSDYQFEKIKAGWIKSIDKLNYRISDLRKCPSKIAVGSPVSIVGYPSYGKIVLDNENNVKTSRIVTNGVVSGYDTSVAEPFGTLPHPNYFISAKIDSGNSGGIAFSKDQNGLCVLGIPTWLNVGNYETQGLIQDINNVLYKKSGFLDSVTSQ